MNVDYRSIGTRVKKYRIRQNLTQAELAKKVGVTAQHISHIECSHTKLSLGMLINLAEVLSVAPSALLDPKSSTDMLPDKELAEVLKNASLQEKKMGAALCTVVLELLICDQDTFA